MKGRVALHAEELGGEALKAIAEAEVPAQFACLDALNLT